MHPPLRGGGFWRFATSGVRCSVLQGQLPWAGTVGTSPPVWCGAGRSTTMRRTPAAVPATTGTRTIGTTTTGFGWGGRPIPLTGRETCRQCGAATASPPRFGEEARPVPGRANPFHLPSSARLLAPRAAGERVKVGVGRANINQPRTLPLPRLVRGARFLGGSGIGCRGGLSRVTMGGGCPHATGCRRAWHRGNVIQNASPFGQSG